MGVGCILLFPVFAFWGYKFHKVMLGITGVAFGGYLAYYLLSVLETSFSSYVGGSISINTKCIIIAVVAICSGVLMVKITKLGVFLLGASAGVFGGNILFAFVISNWIDANSLPANVLYFKLGSLAIMAIIAGIITLKLFQRLLVRIFTALIGGYLLVGGGDYFLWRFGVFDVATYAPNEFLSSNPDNFTCAANLTCWIELIVWAVVWIIGVWYQFRTKDEKYDDSDFDSLEEVVVRHVDGGDDVEDDFDDERRNRRGSKGRRGSKDKRRGSKDGGRRGSKDKGRRGSKDGGRRSSKDGGRRSSKDGGAARRGSKDGGRRSSKDGGRRGSKDGSRRGSKDGGRRSSKDGGRRGSKHGTSMKSRAREI